MALSHNPKGPAVAPAALIVLVAAAALAAQETAVDIDAVLTEFEKASDELTSCSATYRQVDLDEFGDETVYTGAFRYLKPGRYHFTREVGGRVVEETVSDGERGWKVRHGIKKVDVTRLDSIQRGSGIVMTGGAEDLRQCYNVTMLGIDQLPSGPAHHLVCIPNAESKEGNRVDPLTEKMELWINVAAPAPVVKAIVHRRDGSTTSWEFTEISRNADIDTGVFRYRVPRGYEEVEH